jgi:uncharacterized membrane protein YadS
MHMTEEQSTLRFTPRLVLGLAVVLVGVLFTLDNLDLMDAGSLWDYWPLVFVVFGLAKMVDAPHTGSTKNCAVSSAGGSSSPFRSRS